MKLKQMNKKTLIAIALLIAACILIAISNLSIKIGDSEKAEDAALENRLKEHIEMLDGVSRAYVMVSVDSSSRMTGTSNVKGVSVICKGKKSEDLKVKITLLVSTTLGIGSDKIFVTFE